MTYKVAYKMYVCLICTDSSESGCSGAEEVPSVVIQEVRKPDVPAWFVREIFLSQPGDCTQNVFPHRNDNCIIFDLQLHLLLFHFHKFNTISFNKQHISVNYSTEFSLQPNPIKLQCKSLNLILNNDHHFTV